MSHEELHVAGKKLIEASDHLTAAAKALSVIVVDLRVIQMKAKGDDPEEWPADLRVREFPQAISESH